MTRHSRTRSESPLGLKGMRGDPAYWGGMDYSLSGRPAALVESDPMWRAAHIDGGLYRGDARLDDPLYRARLDDPLYRRGPLLNDPFYRGAAYLDNPLYRSGLDD